MTLLESIPTHDQLLLLEYANEIEYWSKISVIFGRIIKNLQA